MRRSPTTGRIPCLWAWSDDGTNAFDAWPGEAMERDANNEGWYYCWIPESATNIIINANDSTVQTTDQKIEAQNTWVTVTDAENVAISYEQQTSGDIPEYVETFKIHAQVPESWQDVRLWAWLDPDGANASDAWPGKAMTAGEDGWYTATAPVWVNRIIVNGNGGEVQTEDLSIDPAEVWVTVAEDGTAEFTYNDPNAPCGGGHYGACKSACRLERAQSVGLVCTGRHQRVFRLARRTAGGYRRWMVDAERSRLDQQYYCEWQRGLGSDFRSVRGNGQGCLDRGDRCGERNSPATRNLPRQLRPPPRQRSQSNLKLRAEPAPVQEEQSGIPVALSLWLVIVVVVAAGAIIYMKKKKK